MAKAKLRFNPFNYDDLPVEIKDDLAIIDAAKARINTRLAEALPEGYKAQHSYKLDFAVGKRVFKIAVYRAAQPKASVTPVASGNLNEWIVARLNGGHAV